MQLDSDGWLEIDTLIKNANNHGNAITLELLHDVVATNSKQRFSLSAVSYTHLTLPTTPYV